MTEEELIKALAEILMNHETGPLSNLGSSIELDDEGMIVVEANAIHPFTDSIDVPQLAREVRLRMGESILNGLTNDFTQAFIAEQASSREHFADAAIRVVSRRFGLGL